MFYSEKSKSAFVKKVFSSVAPKYDMMNDIMSFGLHRLWKSRLIRYVYDTNPSRYIDIATGSGDVAIGVINKFKQSLHLVPEITISDQNPDMLKIAKARLIDKNLISHVRSIVECGAENMDFPDHSFDTVTVSFGARNFDDIKLCMENIARIIAPGGTLLCLEFSPNMNNRIFQKMYRLYSDNMIPLYGKCIANDRESYQYLVDSIRSFPDKFMLSDIIKSAGFSFVDFEELSLGVCNIHYAKK